MKKQSDKGASSRILVIDDDEIVLQAIRDLLEDVGFVVFTMVSPIGATQMIMTERIEAVVVDLNMPVMRGDRFISLLRSWDKIREIPTILISSASAQAMDEASSHLPGVTKVSKETMQRTLPEALRRVLTHAKRSRGRGAAAGSKGTA